MFAALALLLVIGAVVVWALRTAQVNTTKAGTASAGRPAPSAGRPVVPRPSSMPDVSSFLSFDPHKPEAEAAIAAGHYADGRFAVAAQHYLNALDSLHDHYVGGAFTSRSPSDADAAIVRGVTSSVGSWWRMGGGPELVTVVKTATHRLRTISTAVERLRGAAPLYRNGLEELRRAAPDVDISDVLG